MTKITELSTEDKIILEKHLPGMILNIEEKAAESKYNHMNTVYLPADRAGILVRYVIDLYKRCEHE